MSHRDALRSARTFLFVPGDRPDRFDRALAGGADVVVVDLEDAVAPEHKAVARSHALELTASATVPVVVRVNPVGTDEGREDVRALGARSTPTQVMVPKAESRSVLAGLDDALPAGSSVIPLVETAGGILAAGDLATAPGVVRLALGHLDLAADLGLDPEDEERLAPARFALVLASAAATLPPPVDGVCTDVRDPEVVRADAARGLRDGFTGKLCIHPAQVEAVHLALEPDPAELAWARRVLGVATSEHAVTVVDGQMVDRPVIRRARAIVDRARPA